MSEPTLPIDALNDLRWAVRSLVYLQQQGSSEREIMDNATRGIESRIDWVIRQLKAADEGKRNMGK